MFFLAGYSTATGAHPRADFRSVQLFIAVFPSGPIRFFAIKNSILGTRCSPPTRTHPRGVRLAACNSTHFRNGTGFVLPTKMHGSAQGDYAWFGDVSDGLGHQRGTLSSYKKRVLELLVPSPLLCIGVMCALAAPLCSYVFQRTGTRLLAETMVLFFHGRTTTGKSTILSLTSSVYGLPNVGVDWAATERAVAETAHSRNDLSHSDG